MSAESFADEWDRALGFGRGMMFDYAMERAIHGVTTIKMRLGGAFEVQTGPDIRQIMKVLRLPAPRCQGKTELCLSLQKRRRMHICL